MLIFNYLAETVLPDGGNDTLTAELPNLSVAATIIMTTPCKNDRL